MPGKPGPGNGVRLGRGWLRTMVRRQGRPIPCSGVAGPAGPWKFAYGCATAPGCHSHGPGPRMGLRAPCRSPRCVWVYGVAGARGGGGLLARDPEVGPGQSFRWGGGGRGEGGGQGGKVWTQPRARLDGGGGLQGGFQQRLQQRLVAGGERFQ